MLTCKQGFQLFAIAAAVSLSTACGGGGGASEPTQVQAPRVVAPPPNKAPETANVRASVDEDAVLSARLSATDSDGDSLSFSLDAQVSNGSLNLDTNGNYTYTPHPNFNGEDSFSFKVTDGSASASAQVSITVEPINDSPTLSAIGSVTRLNNAVVLPLLAEDIDNDDLRYSVSSLASHGSVTINANQTMTYTPNAGAVGIDTFIVSVSDGNESTDASITIDNNLAFSGSLNLSAGDIEGTEVTLSSDTLLKPVSIENDGSFKVYGLEDGDYTLKVRKSGFKTGPAQVVRLSSTTTQIASASGNSAANDIPQAQNLSIELEELDASIYTYHWQEDQSTAGTDYSASINQALEVTFLDEVLEVVDDASASNLHYQYNIVLVNESDTMLWSQEHAYRLMESMKQIPQISREFGNSQNLAPSKWMLSDEFIEDDIQITLNEGVKTVHISQAAFVNATPKMAKVEGKRGVFFSQRLHHALVRFVTNNGSDVTAYEKILNERFGVSTLVPDYAALTMNTTGGEPSTRFQAFHNEEIVQIINMFEEMPKGTHKLPELQYLVRRLDGQSHPLYRDAPAVAWAQSGYIEFMDTAFLSNSAEYMHRLIIHEKAHFLWENQFDEQLKNDWIELGGWYQDASLTSGWGTSNQTEFVSPYAHEKNPNEDMAESLAFFIVNPDRFRSRAIAKYEFVRDRIMQGNIYISQIREDLSFQVYNLFPDYVFPGKIKRVDISVAGEPEEDKTVSIEIELHALDRELEGAKNAFTRLFSEKDTFVDIYLQPSEGDTSTVLTGEFTLSKFAKAGQWRPQQITITDQVGNQRLEGANDFGWKLYVNNPLEDLDAPEYVANSLDMFVSTSQVEGQEVQIIHATWDVIEDVQMATLNACYSSLNDEILSTYRFEAYGSFNVATGKCEVETLMPHYMPSSLYRVSEISLQDEAKNKRNYYFNGDANTPNSLDELSPTVDLVTNNPDIVVPELDLNDIVISAEPTNPEAPNGETRVTVTFKVRDNISGYNIALLALRDPQGNRHDFWAYNDVTYSIFPQQDPNQWQSYTRTILLPAGSAPGTWGLSEMTIYDRARNFNYYDFTEIVQFNVSE